MSELSAFRRSRIYAQGWNAAREPRSGGGLRKGAINPYTSEPEKSRWNEGYGNALRSNRQQDWFKPSRVEADRATERS